MIGKFFSMVSGGEVKNTGNTPCLQVHALQFLLFREESMWQHNTCSSTFGNTACIGVVQYIRRCFWPLVPVPPYS